ncbi:thioester domain-containing protein [Actinocorallia sp. A-T 12471]|uniref:thioester domain-containing protein n=1 Tax=Actinocorallia sp. A-T 12471 TaxID=3089813 RepID=UPI0029D0C636|nr:thioester domain-containing protein [Actinocorallia sp. A-T 12471]MDX6742350.1 thioester domain-containing protein [Actinocorallia sp. A-T 12471]
MGLVTCVRRVRAAVGVGGRGASRRRRARLAVVAGLALALAVPSSAFAGLNPVGSANEGQGLFTEATIVGTGAGTSVPGWIAPAGFDPLAGYPSGVPADSTRDDSSFAGLIRIADPVDPTRTGVTYCIDLRTDTQLGVNYALGDWNEANVPNLGYVEYILLNYFPTSGQPAAAANDNIRAAAVQSAIWFFSDRYVIDPGSAAIRALVADIVADALANGPSPEPELPELTVTPDTADVPATGEIVGPFAVTGNVSGILRTIGAEVFTDAQGQNQLLDGAEVAPGTNLWARSVSAADPQGFVLERVSTILTGTVLIYDGTNPDLADAQKLVLAQETELGVRAGATFNRFAAGALRITKRITGTGAGFQGEVVVQVECVDQNPETDLDRSYTVRFPAGTGAGDHTRTLGGVPAGSLCTITETATGDNALVNLEADPVIEPPTVTIVVNETAEATITDAYTRATGGVRIVKRIGGPGAGRQDEIVIRLDCTDDAFDRTFTIPARSGPGTYTLPEVTGIPTLSRCRAAEVDSGENRRVRLDGVRVHPRNVVVVDGVTGTIVVKDRYVKCRDKHKHKHAFSSTQYVKHHKGGEHGKHGGFWTGYTHAQGHSR